jgi:DMSO/TMAO reductase YedYZ molybdopterin-dependent catalytic subunit
LASQAFVACANTHAGLGTAGTPPSCRGEDRRIISGSLKEVQPEMAHFVVRHQHPAEQCPARDPQSGADLLNHLSRSNVRRMGVTIRGEAVVQREHTLYLIVESESDMKVQEFMAPFALAGSVEIYPASTCAGVVAFGGCEVPLAHQAESALIVDPADACQTAIEAGLVVHRARPLNCETSIPALIGGVVVPNAHFYVRNHFDIPTLDPARWRLQVTGLFERPLSLSLRDLQNMPSQTLVVTLECAGNGRSLLSPPVEGEKWALGAVSTAEWTGVPLREVINRAGPTSKARELVFRGADAGPVPDRRDAITFERSLTLEDARDFDVLLAYAMNGEQLPIQHGYPVRLVVPRFYGVASVKWLTEIEAIADKFAGFFQADRYHYEWQRDGRIEREPVTLQRVRALITDPQPASEVETGELLVRGVAWSGAAAIARVDVSVGGGPWQEARLIGERNRYSWQWWELLVRIEKTGNISIRARAVDQARRTQPEMPEWNRLGYGSNPIQDLSIRVRPLHSGGSGRANV